MKKNGIDTAAVLTLLTAAAYACAFSFESGYLAHFGLPADFVEVNLRGVLLAVAALLGTGVFMVFQGIFTMIPAKLDPVVARLVYTILLVLVLVGSTLIVLDPGTKTVIFTIAFVSLILFIEFVGPYLLNRSQGVTYLDSLKKASADNQKTAIYSMLQTVGRKWVGLIGLAVVAAVASYLVGASTAKRKAEFLVADDCVALRVHGEHLVCALWDGTLTGEYEFRPVANVRLIIEQLGPIARYTHRNLKPLARRQPQSLEPELAQPPNELEEVDASDGADDTMNLPQPQPLQ